MLYKLGTSRSFLLLFSLIFFILFSPFISLTSVEETFPSILINTQLIYDVIKTVGIAVLPSCLKSNCDSVAKQTKYCLLIQIESDFATVNNNLQTNFFQHFFTAAAENKLREWREEEETTEEG